MGIGDAVIVTDRDARVSLMNSVAEALTGWQLKEAIGRPVNETFRIVDEQTRAAVDSPITRVFETAVQGLASHTVLIAPDGTERAIDDSGLSEQWAPSPVPSESNPCVVCDAETCGTRHGHAGSGVAGMRLASTSPNCSKSTGFVRWPSKPAAARASGSLA